MHAVKKDLAFMRLAMQGLLIVAKKTGRIIPVAAKHLFEGIGRDRARLRDLPLDMVLPVLEELKAMLGGAGDNGGEWGGGGVGPGGIMGLLQSWEELALD